MFTYRDWGYIYDWYDRDSDVQNWVALKQNAFRCYAVVCILISSLEQLYYFWPTNDSLHSAVRCLRCSYCLMHNWVEPRLCCHVRPVLVILCRREQRVTTMHFVGNNPETPKEMAILWPIVFEMCDLYSKHGDALNFCGWKTRRFLDL